jgi:glycosyltransferase involved in cell wall biosynthesis
MFDMSITTIILTYNEEKNISRAINSIKEVSERIVIIDSFSSDNTVKIAKSLGAEVYSNKFTNYSNQFNFAVKIADIKTNWILRLDADEEISVDARDEIKYLFSNGLKSNINGIIIPFEVVFLGKSLKHGGIYPFKKLLLFKKDIGYIENRNMDEHIILKEGRVKTLKNISYHNDFKDLTVWIDKHNKYASREVLDYFSISSRSLEGINTNAKLKRFIKYKFYYLLPMGLRAFSYFIYRYVIRMGFLDGKPGFIFAVLQAFWYRFLVDAKIYEVKRQKS